MRVHVLALLGPQSRYGDKLLEILVVCPQNETAVNKKGVVFRELRITGLRLRFVLRFLQLRICAQRRNPHEILPGQVLQDISTAYTIAAYVQR